MDRQGTVSRFLKGAALLLFLAASADVAPFPVAEARWLAPGTLLEGLTRQPSECLALPREKAQLRKIAIGRAAFRAPLLLGGQAARAGLSCASCHRNGRGNPDFHFDGISGAPGTADVTSSFMSSHRGDGTVNPKPIPDLAAPASDIRVSRDVRTKELESFIRGLIVEEFDGHEPPAAVLEGLAAYVRAIAPSACGKAEPVGLDVMLSDTRAALAAASQSLAAGDRDTALLLIGAARSMLGNIDQRFRLPHLKASRLVLAEADRELRATRASSDPTQAIRAWESKWPSRERKLRLQAPLSLFSPAVLKRHLPSGR